MQLFCFIPLFFFPSQLQWWELFCASQWSRLQYNIQSPTKQNTNHSMSSWKRKIMWNFFGINNFCFLNLLRRRFQGKRENFIAGDNLEMGSITVIWIWQPEFPRWVFFYYSCSKISVLIPERHPLCLTYKVKEIFIYILHMWSYIYTHTHFQISSGLKWLINHCSTPGTGILSPI